MAGTVVRDAPGNVESEADLVGRSLVNAPSYEIAQPGEGSVYSRRRASGPRLLENLFLLLMEARGSVAAG